MRNMQRRDLDLPSDSRLIPKHRTFIVDREMYLEQETSPTWLDVLKKYKLLIYLQINQGELRA